MATLSQEIVKKIEVSEGDFVVFRFRRPKPEELNKFLGNRYVTDRKRGMVDNTGPARCEFFDLLLTAIENLDDEQGPITVDRKADVPVNWKGAIVQETWENVPVVDAKN